MAARRGPDVGAAQLLHPATQTVPVASTDGDATLGIGAEVTN